MSKVDKLLKLCEAADSVVTPMSDSGRNVGTKKQTSYQKQAKDLIVDTFGVSPGVVRGDELIGTQSYSVAIGSAHGKWYGVEAAGRSPQIWEARSRASLLSKIYKDTGIKASKKG